MAYGPAQFGGMVVDAERREAYNEALDRYVRPETRVLDLGCGTGFFTLGALARGAAHVTAVEIFDSVRLLPEVVDANGFGDRCTIYQGDVRKLDLEPFDLVISDMRGSVPLYHDHLDVLSHVHEHLLADNAILLPLADKLRAGLVTLPEWYEDRSAPWHLDAHDWSRCEKTVLSQPVKRSELLASALVTTPIEWGSIDYHSTESLARRSFGGSFAASATRAADAHAIALWFDASIAPGIEYSTEPSSHSPTYGRMIHPFPEPVALEDGEELTITIRAHRGPTSWSWEWGTQTSSERRFVTSLDAMLVSPEQLSAREPGEVSKLA